MEYRSCNERSSRSRDPALVKIRRFWCRTSWCWWRVVDDKTCRGQARLDSPADRARQTKARYLANIDHSHRRLCEQASAQEVAFGDTDFGERAIGGRIAARDREVAGGFLFEIDDENHAVARRAGLVVIFTLLKKSRFFRRRSARSTSARLYASPSEISNSRESRNPGCGCCRAR